MDIYPVVRHDVAHGLDLRFVFQVQLRHQHAQCHVIPVRQACCDGCFLLRHVVHACHQIFHRHRGNHDVSVCGDLLAVFFINHRGDGVVCAAGKAHGFTAL